MNSHAKEPIRIEKFDQFITCAMDQELDDASEIFLSLKKIGSHYLKKLSEVLLLIPRVSIVQLGIKEVFLKKPRISISNLGIETLTINHDLKYLANIFKNCSTDSKLRTSEFDLRRLNINDLGADYLSEIFQHTHENFELNLSHNDITDLGLYIFAKKLKNAPPSFTLNLSDNDICFRTSLSKTLLRAIMLNAPAGFVLDLSNNHLDNNCVTDIANYLKFAPVGFTLNLSSNHVTDVGAEALAAHLKEAPEGFRLFLQKNSFSDRCFKSFIEVLQQTPQVIDFNFSVSIWDNKNNKENMTEMIERFGQILKQNQIRYAKLCCRTFLQNEFVQRLPKDIWYSIFSYVFPDGAEENLKSFVKNPLVFFSSEPLTQGDNKHKRKREDSSQKTDEPEPKRLALKQS